MQDNIKPVANPLLVLREEFDDWAVLFDPDTGKSFGMNPTSVFIWKHLDGGHTVKDIMGKLQATCPDAPEDALTHVEAFVGDLLARGLAGRETRMA